MSPSAAEAKQIKISVVEELGKKLLLAMKENAQSTYEKVIADFSREENELCSKILRNNLPNNISNNLLASIAKTTSNSSLNVSDNQNASNNYTFSTISTLSFIMGCIVDQNEHWKKSKYMKELSKYNSYLNPKNGDLFTEPVDVLKTKLFIYARIVIVNEQVHIHFHIPYQDDISKDYIKFSLENALEVFDDETLTRKPQTKKVKLKKPLLNQNKKTS